MSLYTPPSNIRRLILEAEDLTLAPSDTAASVENAGTTSPDQVATEMNSINNAPAGGPPGLAGAAGTSLSMPNIATPPSTISKTVINKDIILSQLAELKSVITNYEKKFGVGGGNEGDLTPEDANVYISSLLSTLVYHAEKLNSFMEKGGVSSEADMSSMSEEIPAATPEAANTEAGMPPPMDIPALENEAPLIPPTEPQV